MRTHGHREGSITQWGLLWEYERESRGWRGQGGITWGEMSGIGDGGMETANHITMYVPMQQSCMICMCTPEPKVQFKKIYIRKNPSHWMRTRMERE